MSFLSEYTSNLVSFFETFSKFFISTLSLINDDKKGLVETLTFEFNFSSSYIFSPVDKSIIFLFL